MKTYHWTLRSGRKCAQFEWEGERVAATLDRQLDSFTGAVLRDELEERRHNRCDLIWIQGSCCSRGWQQRSDCLSIDRRDNVTYLHLCGSGGAIRQQCYDANSRIIDCGCTNAKISRCAHSGCPGLRRDKTRRRWWPCFWS